MCGTPFDDEPNPNKRMRCEICGKNVKYKNVGVVCNSPVKIGCLKHKAMDVNNGEKR